MGNIVNPILKGFNPDPCITIGHDGAWYIAVSTFEWFPGVFIYRSDNFVDWELVAAPLNRVSQLDMIGEQPSGGIWAPALTYADGKYWLIYTDTKTWRGENKLGMPFRDMYNFLVTADRVDGDWSEPTFLTGGGYDPSLFHDDDGRKYLIYNRRDYRYTHEKLFEGLILQEYDHQQGKLVGEAKAIYHGANVKIEYYTQLQIYEGSHIYKREGYYYLLCAEGGPGYSHSITVSRANNIWGPYEKHPDFVPMLTTYNSNHPIQKAGHGNICKGPDGRDYITYLCSRPLPGKQFSPLGRESGIAPLEWKNGWPYIAGYDFKSVLPPIEFEIPGVPHPQPEQKEVLVEFKNCVKLPLEFQSLRIPFEKKWFSLNKDRKGYLRLYGQDSPVSRFKQSMVARRIQHFNVEIETSLEFNPQSYLQIAGLMLRYDETTFYYLHVTQMPETGEKVLAYLEFEAGEYTYNNPKIAVLPENESVKLKAVVQDEVVRFYWASGNESFKDIGLQKEFWKLSDEFIKPIGFTGSFAAITANDLLGFGSYADFEYFKYTILS
jgi:xylan 1,4-beta-xylosidase